MSKMSTVVSDKKTALEHAKTLWREKKNVNPEENIHEVTGKTGTHEIVPPEDVVSVVHLTDCTDGEFTIKTNKCVKVMVSNCSNCSVLNESTVLSSTMELWSCKNVKFHTTKKLETVQLDISRGVKMHFEKLEHMGQVVQAGVDHLDISFGDNEQHNLKSGRTILRELGENVEETDDVTQFTTRFVEGEVLTEKIIRLANDFPTTLREKKLHDQKSMNEIQRVENHVQNLKGELTKEERKKLKKLQKEAVNDNDFGEEVRAESRKNRGNEMFKLKEYTDAAVLYTEAVTILTDIYTKGGQCTLPEDLPETTANLLIALYSNRSICFIHMQQPGKALDDADACLKIQPTHVKALFRRGLAQMELERYGEAGAQFSKVLEVEPQNKQAKSSFAMAQVKLRKQMQSK